MENKLGKIFAVSVLSLFVAQSALAVCPVCTVAVVAGAGFSRMIGIDDTVSGIWMGGLLTSIALWTILWLDKKGIKFFFKRKIVYALYFGGAYYSLLWANMLGTDCEKIWGYPKILVGIIIGGFLFRFGEWLEEKMRQANQGEVYMYFQKVIVPIGMLSLASLVFYYITKC
jgi:hypothetical protein